MIQLGCSDQVYSAHDTTSMVGGPAILVYYGPALLQKCLADPDQASHKVCMAVAVLCDIYKAGRKLWPLQASSQAAGMTVTLEIGQVGIM